MYDLDKICRTCLSADNTLKSIFSSNTDSILLFSDMLMAVTSIKIVYGDGLPWQICLKCINKVMQAYSFKKECEKYEKILLNYVSDAKKSTESVEHLDAEPIQNITEVYVKFVCSTCNKDFASKSSLRKHERTVHKAVIMVNKDKPKEIPEPATLVKCEWCEYVFVSECTLRKHISSKHRNKETKTNQDGEEEVSNSVPDICDNEISARCGYCNYVFANEDHLHKHILAKHTNNEHESTEANQLNIESQSNQRLFCTSCSIKFANEDSFEEHIKKKKCVNMPCYLCSVCGKIFNRQSNFKIHSLTHTKVRPYACTMCNCSFSAPNTLRLHIRTHTNQRPYICIECGQTFQQSNFLREHKRIHAKERASTCDICGKRFTSAWQLSGHKRTHTGEKPYSCEVCNKKFALARSLKNHSLMHTGERPYVCRICEKQFTQKCILIAHLRTHE